MDKKTVKQLLSDLAEDREETAQALLDILEEQYGTVPLVLRVLGRRPDVLLPQTMKVLSRSEVLGPKVSELVAVAAAAALRCEFCLQVHVQQALKHGATQDEVFESLLIAGMIAESSTQAVAFRVFEKVAGSHGHPDGRKARGEVSRPSP